MMRQRVYDVQQVGIIQGCWFREPVGVGRMTKVAAPEAMPVEPGGYVRRCLCGKEGMGLLTSS